MAREGLGRLAALLRSPDQLPVPPEVCASSQENVVACLATPVTEGPLYMGHHWPIGGRLLAPAADSAPMAEDAVCRQTPKVGAWCSNGPAGICAGGAG